MIIQVLMDIEVEDNYDKSSVEAFANTIEKAYDYPVLKARVTTRWKDEEHYMMSERTEIVMRALDVEVEDAVKIVEHLTKHDCLGWIDNYDYKNRSKEPLVDVHYEPSVGAMIDWKYEDVEPSEILGISSNIKDYPEMLELEDEVILWYGLV